MIEVYVIESEKDGTWSPGMATHAETRLKEHNSNLFIQYEFIDSCSMIPDRFNKINYGWIRL